MRREGGCFSSSPLCTRRRARTWRAGRLRPYTRQRPYTRRPRGRCTPAGSRTALRGILRGLRLSLIKSHRRATARRRGGLRLSSRTPTCSRPSRRGGECPSPRRARGRRRTSLVYLPSLRRGSGARSSPSRSPRPLRHRPSARPLLRSPVRRRTAPLGAPQPRRSRPRWGPPLRARARRRAPPPTTPPTAVSDLPEFPGQAQPGLISACVVVGVARQTARPRSWFDCAILGIRSKPFKSMCLRPSYPFSQRLNLPVKCSHAMATTRHGTRATSHRHLQIARLRSPNARCRELLCEPLELPGPERHPLGLADLHHGPSPLLQ